MTNHERKIRDIFELDDDDKVDVRKNNKDDIFVSIDRLNQSVKVTFSRLRKTVEYFGCTECNIDTSETRGCDTCDWGAHYCVTLHLWERAKVEGDT